MNSARRKGIHILLALSVSAVMLAVMAVPVSAIPPSQVWVDDDYYSGGFNDGHTWGWDAFDKIQNGISAVISPGMVHVAAGTYYENITLKDGVEVLGAGPDFTTIDGGCSGSVVTGSYLGSTTKLDGFTITNGCISGSGGGIRLYQSSPTINNCRLSNNSATYHGGGVYLHNSSSPIISNCIFSGNSATTYYGGGMFSLYYCSPTVTNCIFSGNSGYYGGGMYNENHCSPTVTNCIFSGNSGYYGGGIYNDWFSSPTVTNCIFSENSATSSGGGMYNYYYSSPTVTNCDFWGNSATSGSGGGMYNNYHSSPTICNNIVVGNTALAGGGIGADTTCSPTIDYNDMWNNSPNDYSGCSAGPNDISQDPLLVQPAVGNYHLQSDSPCIDVGTNVGVPTADMKGRPRPIDGDGDGTATTDMGAYEYMPPPSPHFRYLHSEGSMIDLAAPVSTQWNEILPFFNRHYHLSNWEDNGDGVLSPCDEIGLDEEPDGQVRVYHVEEVTITLFVTHNETGGAKYIELEGGYNASVLMTPVCTQWHEIHPVFCKEYHLSDWEDTNMSGNLTACDYIVLTNNATGRVAWWHVEDVATDIVVALKPPPVGGEAYPVDKTSLLAPWIAVGVVLAGGISWYVLRRRKAQS